VRYQAALHSDTAALFRAGNGPYRGVGHAAQALLAGQPSGSKDRLRFRWSAPMTSSNLETNRFEGARRSKPAALSFCLSFIVALLRFCSPA
jgi:hypothetical protein